MLPTLKQTIILIVALTFCLTFIWLMVKEDNGVRVSTTNVYVEYGENPEFDIPIMVQGYIESNIIKNLLL